MSNSQVTSWIDPHHKVIPKWIGGCLLCFHSHQSISHTIRMHRAYHMLPVTDNMHQWSDWNESKEKSKSFGDNSILMLQLRHNSLCTAPKHKAKRPARTRKRIHRYTTTIGSTATMWRLWEHRLPITAMVRHKSTHHTSGKYYLPTQIHAIWRDPNLW